MTKQELEERLINFVVMILEIIQEMPESKIATHLAGQLIRSSTSTALNYGEAQSGESRKDFIHKMNIVLKELRESNICMKIIQRTKLFSSDVKLVSALKENNELISIFVKSVETANKNIQKVKEGIL